MDSLHLVLLPEHRRLLQTAESFAKLQVLVWFSVAGWHAHKDLVGQVSVYESVGDIALKELEVESSS